MLFPSPRSFLFAAILTLGLAGCVQMETVPAPVGPVPWPHETSDLKPDPAIVWGRLDNGLRYAIRPHATPRERVSICLVVQTGSHFELRREAGYAHFIEHLAFRELRGVPDGVFATLEKLGANSYGGTSFFETEYRFDFLPAADPDALATSLRVLRAIADGIVFDPRGVERERGVIADEERTNDATLVKARPDELEFLTGEAPPTIPELATIFSHTRLAGESAIGTAATVRAATAAKLRAFYEHWYRPERMILSIVGDVTPAAIEPLVAQTFASLAAPTRPLAVPIVAPPQLSREFPVLGTPSDHEPALHVSLNGYRAETLPDSRERRRQSLARRLALAMLDRRYERLARSDAAPFTSADPLLSHNIPGFELALLRADTPPPRWPQALAALDYEVRRAIDQGFAATELARAVKDETIRVNAAARQAEQRTATEMAKALAFAIARGVVFTSAADDRDLTAAQLATITEAQCQDALKELLAPEKRSLTLLGPLPEGEASLARVAPTLDASRAEPLTAYAPPPPLRPFPYTDFGPAGQVAQTTHDADLDADLIQFANGVRLNLRRTNFEPGRVQLHIRLHGGRLAIPPDKPGLDLKALFWLYGGLKDLTPEELSASVSDLSGSMNFGADGNNLHLDESDDAANLPLLLQVAAAYFVHPGFREEKRAAELARQAVASYRVTASGVASVRIDERMAGNHPATRLATVEEMNRLTMDDLKAWLVPHLASAPLEISLIGDFESATAIDAVARTFGALPPRATGDPYAAARQIAFPPKPFSEESTFDGNGGVADVMLAWPVAGDANSPVQFHAVLLANILEQRLWQKLRVELGETYLVGAKVAIDPTVRPMPFFVYCQIEAAPERITKIAAIAREVAATLARNGATVEEFERARRPRINETESGLRNNAWLLDLISVAQSNPAYSRNWTHALEAYQTASLAEIDALGRETLGDAQCSQLIVRPK